MPGRRETTTKSAQRDSSAVGQQGTDGIEQVNEPGLVLTNLLRPHPNLPSNPSQPAEQGLLPLSYELGEGLLQGQTAGIS